VLPAYRPRFAEPEPTLDVRQQQHAGIGGQATAVEGGPDHLAGDRARKGGPIVPFHDALRVGSG
jgi:hypothetical protein